MFERREDGLVGGLHAGGAVEAADEPGVDAGRVEVVQARLGGNSIDIVPSQVWSFETGLNFECPSTEVVPELAPVLHPVLCLKFQMSI